MLGTMCASIMWVGSHGMLRLHVGVAKIVLPLGKIVAIRLLFGFTVITGRLSPWNFLWSPHFLWHIASCVVGSSGWLYYLHFYWTVVPTFPLLLGEYDVSHELKFPPHILTCVSTSDCDIIIVACFVLFYIYHIFNVYGISMLGRQLRWINIIFSFIFT